MVKWTQGRPRESGLYWYVMNLPGPRWSGDRDPAIAQVTRCCSCPNCKGIDIQAYGPGGSHPIGNYPPDDSIWFMPVGDGPSSRARGWMLKPDKDGHWWFKDKKGTHVAIITWADGPTGEYVYRKGGSLAGGEPHEGGVYHEMEIPEPPEF